VVLTNVNESVEKSVSGSGEFTVEVSFEHELKMNEYINRINGRISVFIFVCPPNGLALSCGADKFQFAENEMSSH
jgi:hypothetical protein